MAIYVYVTATGELHSYAPDDATPVASAETLLSTGLSVLTGQPPLDSTHAWQPSPPAVIVVAAPPTQAMILTSIWILRFTPAEFGAIMASTDPQVQQWLYALNHTTQVDLSTSAFTEGIPYLATRGLLATARVAAILATPSSLSGP